MVKPNRLNFQVIFIAHVQSSQVTNTTQRGSRWVGHPWFKQQQAVHYSVYNSPHLDPTLNHVNVFTHSYSIWFKSILILSSHPNPRFSANLNRTTYIHARCISSSISYNPEGERDNCDSVLIGACVRAFQLHRSCRSVAVQNATQHKANRFWEPNQRALGVTVAYVHATRGHKILPDSLYISRKS